MEPSRIAAKRCYAVPGANVCSRPVEVPAAARARWLAEVAETLDQAELLVNRLERDGYRAPNLLELTMRIEAAKYEVGLLRMSRQARAQTDPQWTKLPPWENGEQSGI